MNSWSKFEIFRQVEPNIIEFIRENSSILEASKDRAIFREKEKFDGIYIGIEGKFSIEKVNYLGEKKVIFILGKADILNEFIKKEMESSISCISLTKTKYLFIHRNIILQALKRSNTLMINFMEYEEKKLYKLYRQLGNTVGAIRGDKRLATKLWKLSKDFGTTEEKGIAIDIPLTVTYMSELTGAKRETVSRQLKKLVDKGLIVQNGVNILVVSREKLREYIFSNEK